MIKKTNQFYKFCICASLLFALTLTGCAGDGGRAADAARTDVQHPDNEEQRGESAQKEEPQPHGESAREEKPQPHGESAQGEKPQSPDAQPQEPSEQQSPQTTRPEPTIKEADWSDYFDGVSGAAVVYDPAERCFQIYNKELADTRRSPCSTFKIVSALTALENGIIEPDGPARAWSGETFWNADWNRDINFADAFHTSCVWYFREVVDEIGAKLMQKELDRLDYGNRDISDWEGKLNTNNQNRALTGFWIESSLLISPKEQVEVLERIFGDASDYSEETRRELMEVMLLPESGGKQPAIYGKTGMGKAHGVLMDAWFAGFAEKEGRRVYFCVYLGETDDARVSSATAREIAVELVSDLFDS